MASADASKKLFEVALSFAGEDRQYVRQVASFLRASGVRVFYDEFEQVKLWGKDLVETLDEVFRLRSEFVIMFVSIAYKQNEWARHERRSALAAALQSKREYVLPARFDETELDGMPPSIATCGS